MHLSLQLDKSTDMTLIDSLRIQIKTQIRDGKLVVGSRLPSLRQLERQTGASLGIIRDGLIGLANEGYVSIEHGRGIFVSDPLSTKKSIVLVLPSINLEIGRMLHGVKEGLHSRAVDLVLQAADVDFDEEAEMIRRLTRSTIAGAIIYPPLMSHYATAIQEVRDRKIPLVLIDTLPEGLDDVDAILTNEKLTGDLAFSHLLERGHRRIGVIDSQGDASTIKSIRQGARTACSKFGVDFDALPKAVSLICSRENPWAEGERLCRELLATARDLTAIVALDDNNTAGALIGLQKAGIKIPEEISLVGIGNLSAFQLSTPPVTAVDRPYERIGRAAAVRLLETIRGATKETRIVQFDPTLIERDSVCPPARTTRPES